MSDTTTWVGVAASAVSGAVACTTLYFRTRAKLKLAAIDRGTPEAARVVADAVTSFRIEVTGLTTEQRFQLARDEISARDRRHARWLWVSLAGTVVLALATVFVATWQPEPPTPGPPLPQPLVSSLPVPASTLSVPTRDRGSDADKAVANLREKIQENWLNWAESNAVISANTLKESAQALAVQLEEVPEKKLGVTRAIQRADYAAAAYAMAATVTNAPGRTKLVEKCLELGSRAQQLIDLVKRKGSDASWKNTRDLIRSDDVENRVLHTRIICLSFRQSATELAKALQTLKDRDTNYFQGRAVCEFKPVKEAMRAGRLHCPG